MLHCSYLVPKPDHPKEQSKSEAAAVLLTGIAESSTASKARMRLEQDPVKLKGKAMRVFANACSACMAWQACPRRSGDLVVRRPCAVRRPTGPETMNGSAERLQLLIAELFFRQCR